MFEFAYSSCFGAAWGLFCGYLPISVFGRRPLPRFCHKMDIQLVQATSQCLEPSDSPSLIVFWSSSVAKRQECPLVATSAAAWSVRLPRSNILPSRMPPPTKIREEKSSARGLKYTGISNWSLCAQVNEKMSTAVAAAATSNSTYKTRRPNDVKNMNSGWIFP